MPVFLPCLLAPLGLSSNLRGWHNLAVAFSGALLVGALDELHQMYFPAVRQGYPTSLQTFWEHYRYGTFGNEKLAFAAYRTQTQGNLALMESTRQGNSR
jgi:hypothetical protein